MKRRLPLFAMLIGSIAVIVAAALVLHLHFHHHHKPATAHRAPTVKIAGMKPVAPNTSISVVAVQKSLTAGTLIEPGMLVRKTMPASAFHHGEMIWSHHNLNHFVGAMLRKPVRAQTPLTRAMVLEPGDHGFLAAVLRPGHEALTIGVNAETDSAGLIWPGDHVGVMLIRSPSARKLQSGDAMSADDMSAMTIVSNARVVATGGALFRRNDPKKKGKNARTVTLGVTPRQAQTIVLAEKLGSLSISLLSAKNPPSPAAPTWGYQVATKGSTAADPGRQDITVTTATDQKRFTVP